MAHPVHAPPGGFSPMPILPVTEQGLVLTRGTHRPDSMAIVASEVVHEGNMRIEADAIRSVRFVSDERTRPVVAINANIVSHATPSITSGRKENDVAVQIAGHQPSVDSVFLGPFPCAFFH